MASLAQAKDVLALRVGVEYARANLEKAEAKHKDNLQRESEKRSAKDRKLWSRIKNLEGTHAKSTTAA
jgi:hypothetical protein